ncbi:MAG: hypothetical protein IPP74_02320 [Alphaproteobacteria bacterium]|nr:hypothetical protein [Alphaproteobacteria bacterium]
MKGEVIYLYAFDVANEIKTDEIKDVLANRVAPFEIRTDHTSPKDMPMYKPLSLEPSQPVSDWGGQEIFPRIRIYDIGVISIAIHVPFVVNSIPELMPFHTPFFNQEQSLDQLARRLCTEACTSLKEIMIRTSPLLEPEAYTVFCITEMPGQDQDLGNWFSENRMAIADLLTENHPGILNPMQVNEVLKVYHSYSTSDITIIDWDAALMVDLTGYVEDTVYVLELANLQLEEYRVMDQRLDRYLNKAYESIQRKRFGTFRGNESVLRKLRELRVDVTKLNDEVTHITKFFGDWYLARVYLGARERFHLDEWRTSVQDRLEHVDTLYTVTQSELTNSRMFWMELMIVIFFAIELYASFFLKK